METISLDNYLELLEGLYLGKRDVAFEDFALLFAEGVERLEGNLILSRKGVAVFPGAEPLAWDDVALSDGRRLRLWLRDGTVPKKAVRVIQLLDQLVGNTELLRRVAISDALTGVLNRRGFEEWLAMRAKRFDEQAPCTVAFLDVDNFKRLNDELGHDKGDSALKEIAETLQTYVGEQDVVARYGGDEFVMVLDGRVLGNAVKQQMEQMAMALFERPYPLSVTVGLAGYPQHGETLEEVVKAADAAMYAGKHDGKSRVVTADNALPETGLESEETETTNSVQAHSKWAIARSFQDLKTKPK